jgi:hypothetical protein
MLKCCELDGDIYLFLSSIAVGDFFRALFCNVIKSGGPFQKIIFYDYQGSNEPYFSGSSFHKLLYTTLTTNNILYFLLQVNKLYC